MQQPIVKPALILDDNLLIATTVARNVRRLGGLPVVHLPSIEDFYIRHLTPFDALKQYSAIICDDSFGYSRKRGFDFLLQQVGPILQTMVESNRPKVLFMTTDPRVVRTVEEKLWHPFSIASFDKTSELGAIGLAVRIAQEYGVSLSREQIIKIICQQSLEDASPASQKARFLEEIRKTAYLADDFKAETAYQVAGPAETMEWQQIVSLLAQEIKIPPEQLISIINREVEKNKKTAEGKPTHLETK